jgi:chemotaxis protein CheX
MKAEYVAPFAEAASAVAEMVMGCRPLRGNLAVKTDLFTVQPINILCGVNGDLEGLVMYSMSKETALGVAGLMLGSVPTVFDQLAASAISELGNMITGNSSSNFSSQGILCNITPPTLVRGTRIQISTFDTPTLVVPLQFGDIGTLEVNISLRQTRISLAAA